MRTLYLRNVPDDVVDRLERLAARDSMSVNAVAVRELAEVSRRVGNVALLGDLPHHDRVSVEDIVAGLPRPGAPRPGLGAEGERDAHDATYVALAELLDCPLVTADGRLSRAPGLRCAVTLLPS